MTVVEGGKIYTGDHSAPEIEAKSLSEALSHVNKHLDMNNPKIDNTTNIRLHKRHAQDHKHFHNQQQQPNN